MAKPTKRPSTPPPQGSAELLAACDEVVNPQLLASALSRVSWPHRERILTPAIMVVGLLRMVVMVLPSFLQLVDLLRRGKLGAEVPASASAFYKRLHVMPHDCFRAVLQEVTAVVTRGKTERRGIRALAPWAKGMYSVDDTTLDAMARKTVALIKHPKGAMETLAGRVSCAIDLRTGLLAEALYDSNAKNNEKPHFNAMLDGFGSNNLFTFDLGYFSFSLFDRLTESGNFFVTRLRNKATYETVARGVHTQRYRESLVYLGAHRADRAAHPVRLVEMLIGTQWHQYLTNVLDPKELSAGAVWKIYRERWGIENIFSCLKQALKLAYIHPCHTNGVLAQVWSTLTVYQVLQDLRLKAGEAHGCGGDDVSWFNLMQRISWYTMEKSALSLTDWLLDTTTPLFLEKRGKRLRVPTALAGQLAKDFAKAPIDWTVPPPRAARQGKPEPAPQGSIIETAGLRERLS